MKRHTFGTVVRAKGDHPSITITTPAVDRDKEIVDPLGADLTAYRRNPTVLFGHDYSALPVGVTTAINVTAQGINATWRWLENDPMADRVRNAFEQGVLNAASIGFLPVETAPAGPGLGRRYTKWQLLEWSLVPVPSNPEAVRTLKRLDLWRDDERVAVYLRDEPELLIQRQDVAAILRDVVRSEVEALIRAVVKRELERRRGNVDAWLA